MAVLLNFEWGERNLYKFLPVLSALLDSIYVFFYFDIEKGKKIWKFQKWELYNIVFVFVSESNFIIKALFLKWITHFIGAI